MEGMIAMKKWATLMLITGIVAGMLFCNCSFTAAQQGSGGGDTAPGGEGDTAHNDDVDSPIERAKEEAGRVQAAGGNPIEVAGAWIRGFFAAHSKMAIPNAQNPTEQESPSTELS